ncbi:MAG: 16S rRNA methyltransferase [Chloroflexi bacterium]|nr:16S rRNA methyltransferase [Ardenticatenaceae bacterium]MBL1127683.1 16S rRNA methyltransferase [Chloroflexota bacterium]NOG33748.1 16S rRNA methyltransferase [Chloroflexota bacterium]GIK56069.1 MAG: 16S rRNA methyltransferase [Chloroflexota bacterium]
MNQNLLLDELLTAVTQSPKYRAMAPDLIRRIGAAELAKRRSFKEAVKGTKNKLHQVGGAYWDTAVDYPKALARLQNAEDEETRRQIYRDLMRLHASTRERLPILDEFYATTLAGLPPIHSVVDMACGLNPLAIPWMPLAADVVYHAYDIYGDMLVFLQEYFGLMGINGRTHHQDLLSQPPAEPADLALILKTLPCLEQAESGAAARLLGSIQARHLLISYPAQSLGGRGKGMVGNYEAQFWDLVNSAPAAAAGEPAAAAGRDWHITRFEFATELAFLVTTS